MSETITITKEQLEGIALAAARVAVQENMKELTAMLGINLNNIDAVEAWKADIRFAGTLRSSSHTVGSRVALATLTGLVIAIATSAWTWTKSILHLSN